MGSSLSSNMSPTVPSTMAPVHMIRGVESVHLANIDAAIPPGSWDSHVHVVDESRFPLHPDHPYRPKTATVDDLEAFHAGLGIEHACLVAFSVYQTDNRCLVDGLYHLSETGRGVAAIDPETVTDSELNALHAAGVRAIRLNMRTTGAALNVTAVKLAADKVRRLSWALQLYIALSQVTELAPIIPKLGVPVVIDHIGAPEPDKGPGRGQPGYSDLIELLRGGQVWTKLSGTYRFPNLPDLDEYVVEILRAAPDRVVWASDWPHSGGVEKNPGGDRNKTQEYRKVDDVGFVRQCKAWCMEAAGGTGEELITKIWVDNPQTLWQYHPSTADNGDALACKAPTKSHL